MTNPKITMAELKDLASKEDFVELRKKVADMLPYDLSEFLQGLTPDLRNKILSNLQYEVLIELIPELPEEMQLEFIEVLSPRQAAEFLAGIPPDEMVDVLGDLPLDIRKNIVGYFTREKHREARSLLKHRPDTAGGLMTTEVVSLTTDYTVQEAIEYIRQKAREYETVYYMYVTDSEKRLVGVLSLRDLVLAPPEAKLKEIMNTEVIKVPVDMDQEEVASLIADYDLLALPVVEKGDKLLGIVTVDDVIDVIEEEVTEDMAHMSGTSGKIDKLIDAPSISVVKARLPWLIVTLIGGLLAGSVIGLFEVVLDSVVFLIIFVPVIMAMGGNVAMQSSTVFVRGLATGEIERPMRYFLREIKIGFMMGCLVGLGTAIAAQLWKGMPILGAIAGTAMFFTVILATANGVLVPKLFDRLGIDPAISASPFVTTIQDIIGLVIYFSLATVMLLYIT